MFATLKRLKIRARRWYDRRSLVTQDNLANIGWVMLTVVLGYVVVLVLLIGTAVLATHMGQTGQTGRTGWIEPLGPGEYEAIQQIHRNGQVVTA
jgi:hypothetical protein